MILDSCDRFDRYLPLGKGFEKARTFLLEKDLPTLPPGKYPIDGDLVYAIVARDQGRNKEDALLETHDLYIDVQMVLSGLETMGWKPRAGCAHPAGPHDPERDIRFYKDAPDGFVTVQPGQFAVFFPEDAHMPLLSGGMIHKVVVKIREIP